MPWLSVEGTAVLRETYYTSRAIDVFSRRFAPDPLTGDPTETIGTFSRTEGAINRRFYRLQAELIGPALYRVYPSRSVFSSTYKHVVEPHLVYQFAPSVEEQLRVPIFDDRDPLTGYQNVVTFSIVNRLFAKRPTQVGPPRTGTQPDGSATGGTLPWSSFPAPVESPPPPPPVVVTPETDEPDALSSEEPEVTLYPEGPRSVPGLATSASGAAGSAPAVGTPGGAAPAATGSGPATPVAPPSLPPGAAPPPPAQRDPVEILNVEVSQSYSFRAPLSTRFRQSEICADGTAPPCPSGIDLVPRLTAEGTRRYSPLSFSLHFNPLLTLSLDLRADYDLTNSALSSNSVSGWYRWKTGYVNATWFRQSPVNAIGADASQVRLGSGALFFNRKLTLDGELGYDLRRSAALDRRARVGYYTQCCGFIVEYLEREFDVNARREVHFVIDLKGIGKFLDPNVSLGTK